MERVVRTNEHQYIEKYISLMFYVCFCFYWLVRTAMENCFQAREIKEETQVGTQNTVAALPTITS